ncbi:YceD family protein [Xylophilus sp.]|uniref:YceD family protein n=1 Tax=Xylophilus sp. TaxID=2653893 RepID=UPI0013B604BC|nr:YceD family protein [Xylophilus sp.]KAF1045799.1 MAG: Large ribosomal RNA subunit accumulation protein YceD [Xylophilus sp.]
MSASETDPVRLDIQAFIRNGRHAEGVAPLARFTRLAEDLESSADPQPVRWSAAGRSLPVTGGEPESWLRLHVEAVLPLTCQRCLGPVDVPVVIDRDFRFVATEEQALAEDDDTDDELLVLSREFNLLDLIEDELILDLPAVPRHDVCPVPVRLSVEDADFAQAEAEQPHPFAGLAALRGRKDSGS